MNPKQGDLGDAVSWLSVALIAFFVIDKSLPLFRAILHALGLN